MSSANAPLRPETRLTSRQVAQFLGMSESWLEKTRWSGMGGPPYRKIGRSVRYVWGEVLQWDEARRRTLR